MKKLNVILRTCDKVNAFSGTRPRDFGSKFDVMKKCLTSVNDSIDYFKSKGGDVDVIVVDDNSSTEMKNFLNEMFPNKIINLEIGGNGNSFVKCVDLAIKCDGLVFLLEDDYLLKKECFHSIVGSYHKIKNECNIEPCFYPSDYPDRYKNVYKSYVLLGSDRHYRSIKHTTCTFMYDSSIYKEFENELKFFKNYGYDANINEDNSINLVYKKYICFSPIPSLAEHYQYKETLSPFYE